MTILAAGLVVPFLPYFLSFAAGAMVYVVVEELIPDLVPATVLFLIFFLIMVGVQMKAFAKGLTPLPKRAWVFSVLFGLPAAVILKHPNLPFTNALATGWISIGNIWMFGSLLWLTGKNKKKGGGF